MSTFTLAVFCCITFVLLFVGLYWLVLVVRRHPYLLRVSGTVLTVDREQSFDSKTVTFYPNIAYSTPEGKQVRFRSNSGVTRDVRKAFQSKMAFSS